MQRWLPVLFLGLLGSATVRAQGLLVPADKDLAPLAMVNQDVQIKIEDQAAVTKVTQTFRNPTSQQLEATYLFPVPKGASVKKFVMWVDGKEVSGELVEADKARTIYTDIVRRMQDPGLLEYVGSNLLRLRVFPIPAHGDQKLAVSFTSIASQEDGLVEYVYPLKGSNKAAGSLEKFTLKATLKSQHSLQNIYSPSHAVKVERNGDHEATVTCEMAQTVLDKDFQLYYTQGSKDVELTLLTCRPSSHDDGTFMLLISPRAELAKTNYIARDLVFVLDTSGSMQGPKMEQAKKALKFCLGSLSHKDRFAVMNFATTVNKYADHLVHASGEQVEHAKKWVDELTATGGTAIDAALDAALQTRTDDHSRTFTVVFFTDGQPTVGETNPENILKKVMDRNTANTRIFTFGVGDDVNAALLDQLADKTRAVSTYVRPAEDIEVKTSGLWGKISHPVMTNLKLTASSGVKLSEIYPANLPDLFHGSQLVVLGRYHGKGHTAITLQGSVGHETREFVYEVNFPGKTDDDKAFVVDLWARRKVGYLLEQIRSNGEKKELVDEVIALAKKHAIATPYTSYLVVPDNVTPAPVATNLPSTPVMPATTDPTLYYRNHGSSLNATGSTLGTTTDTFTAGGVGGVGAAAPGANGRINYAPVYGAPQMQWSVPQSGLGGPAPSAATIALTAPVAPLAPPPSAPIPPQSSTYNGTLSYEGITEVPPSGAITDLRTGKGGVDLAVQLNEMRNQSQVGEKMVRQAGGRTCYNVRGVWADEGYDPKMKQVTIKAMSAAYFRMLERQPQMKEVFQLGNHVVWVTPNGCALVIDTDKGAETMSDAEIDALFVGRK
jgi:Ca-activated chloride channel family protein